MSGIFSIFSESENAISILNNKGAQSLKIKTENIEVLPVKNILHPQIKPKGLSIRSKSDLNVPASNHVGASKMNPQEFKIPKDKRGFLRSVSPIKRLSPKKKIESYATKRLSPKIKSVIHKNVVDDFVFVKPVPPKDFKKLVKQPEPERLAYYENPKKLMDDEIERIFEADAMLLRPFTNSGANDSLTTNEDDSGFLSDPSFESNDSFMDISLPEPSPSPIKLPEISDDED